MSQIQLPDGRVLDLIDNQVESDTAVLFHHGTPGNSTSWEAWSELLKERGIRAIAASRPGYALSDRKVGRKVVDVVEDLSQLLDDNGITRFVSIGWSGGGPHALAMSLDIRCLGVITLAGVGQYGKSDLDFLAGMGPENIEEFGISLQGEGPLRKWMNANAVGMQEVTGDSLREAFGELIGKADKEVLSGTFADEIAGEMRKALSHGFDGWIDDDLAFVQDWGFELAGINVPVHIWQGDDDFMVPQTHSRWLTSKIPHAQLTFIPENGHFSLIVKHRDKIVTQLQQLIA